jgi:hypothetical protein
MNTRTTNSQYHSGDRTSERAPRFSGRRDNRRPTTEPQILRRWAVADLIAAARWRSAFA